MAAPVEDALEEICLIDVESNEDFKVIVSSKDAIKARNGKKINNIFENIYYNYTKRLI